MTKAIVSNRGFDNDRMFMIVDANNIFITQRNHHKMAMIQSGFSGDSLTLSAPDNPTISIKILDEGVQKQVVVWKDECSSIDQGDEAADWLSAYLGTICRLVKMEPTFLRKLDPRFALSESNHTAFADGYPFLLLSQESLNDLNRRLRTPIPMNRFRPNIVVEGCSAYDEDKWQKIKVGGIVFEVVKPCVRCKITTIDQTSLATSKEPLATLATYRISPLGGVIFGQNLIHHNNGHLEIADEVEILELK